MHFSHLSDAPHSLRIPPNIITPQDRINVSGTGFSLVYGCWIFSP